MKKTLVPLLLLSVMCGAHAQTQAQMNAQACANYQKADRQLNTLY